MHLMKSICEKAKSSKKTVVLPEGTEERIIKATEKIVKEQIAHVILLGDEEEINQKASRIGISLSDVEIIDPVKSDKFDLFVDHYVEIRKNKGMTPEKARELMKTPLYFGTMMLKQEEADGLVAGSVHSTGDVLRPLFQIIKTAPGISVVSSCFIVEVPNCEYGDQGAFIMGDCAINPNPTAEELASIAVASAQTAVSLLGMDPKVAMLSFSTKGSAKHELVDKVVEATNIAKQIAPDLVLDGELQADAALVETVGNLKAPGSPVAGKANVLIFPDLQSANIGYKLVQRLANAEAVGPISQGLAKPANDLSRGCSVDDIVNVTAITAVQAQNQ